MIRINLIGDALPATGGSFGAKPIIAGVLAAAILVAAHVVLGARLATLTATRDDVRSRLFRVRTEAAIAEKKATTRPVDRQARTAAGTARRLRSVARSVPERLWLVGYREHGASVVLRGIALSDEGARGFVDALAQASGFHSVDMTETVRRVELPDAGADGESRVQEFRVTASFDFETVAGEAERRDDG